MISKLLLSAAVGVVAVGSLATANDDKRPIPAHREAPMTAVVDRVIDGDTVHLDFGVRVRLIGIDTPENGECGYREATTHLRRLVEGRTVSLPNPGSVDDVDKYDRLLLYVDRGHLDAGYAQIRAGLAVARYDSRDGYDHHPRQSRYRATSAATTPLCEQREADRSRLRRARHLADRAGIDRHRGEDVRHLINRARHELRRQHQAVLAARRAARAAAAREAAQEAHGTSTGSSSGGFTPPPGWTTDALTPGYTGCRQGYPGGTIGGVYVWKPISC